MKKKLMSLMTALAMVSMAAFVTSCESEDTDEDISSSVFNIDRDLKSYSGSDSFKWNTTNTQARVQMEVAEFRTGDTSIQVYDGNGRLIFSRTYLTANNVIYTGDNKYVSVGTTSTGAAGEWIINLSYDNFTGEQELTLD